MGDRVVQRERAGALYSWVSQYTLAAPDSRVDATLSLLRLDKIDLPFLVPVPAAGMHITVQGVSRLPDPIEQRLPNLLEAVKGELATSTPSMQPSPNRLSDTAACSAMHCPWSGSRPYATPLGEDSIDWFQCPRRGATGRTWRLRTRQAKVRSTRCADRAHR